MKKTNIKTKAIAGVLSAITMISVGTMAMTATAIPAAAASVDVEDYGKQAGINAADAAFDTIGNVFPGAGILVSPFKTLFHANVDEENPMTAMNKKLDQMDRKLDDIQNDLHVLDRNIEKNVSWLGNKTELSELKTNYRNLSAVLEDLAKDVYAIENDNSLNNQQKMMKLVLLKKDADFRDAKRYCTIIRDYMDGSNPYVSTSMFELLYSDKAANCMTEKEAYNEAYPAAEELTKQYVYAVSLLAECQKASDAVCCFTDIDVAALGADLKADYNRFNKQREQLDASDASKMLVAAATGAESFKMHDANKIIFKTSKSLPDVVGRTQNTALYKGMKNTTADYVNKSVLSANEIKELAAYVREKYPNTSLVEYLRKNGAMSYSFNVADNGTAYILTSTELETKEKDAGTEFLGKVDGALLYDCTVYAKGINIYSPKCEEESIKVYTYRREDIYGYGIKLKTYYKNCYYYDTRVFTLYNDLSDDEQKEYKTFKDYADWRNARPEFANMSQADYNGYLSWKNAHNDLTLDDYVEYLNCKALYKKYNGGNVSLYANYLVAKANPTYGKYAAADYERYLRTGEFLCCCDYLTYLMRIHRNG